MSNFEDFTQNLHNSLQKPLPGLMAHLQMAPAERAEMMNYPDAGKDAREAAVMILFHPVDDQPYLVFIVRQSYDGVHSGQISFPGGKREPNDKDLIQTAIRETAEEIGIDSRMIRVLGTTSPLFIPPSNFLVTPVVGYCPEINAFSPQESEVKEVLNLPFSHFTDGRFKKVHTVNASYKSNMMVPCYRIQEHIIWGATAMILSELVAIIRN